MIYHYSIKAKVYFISSTCKAYCYAYTFKLCSPLSIYVTIDYVLTIYQINPTLIFITIKTDYKSIINSLNYNALVILYA